VATKNESLEPIDEVARLLALKRERGLGEVIAELDSVGIKQSRIAELLGTSPGYVNVALSRAKEAGDKKKSTTKKAKPA
jgi:DNA-directed RNA polymerase specialized sigma24 family protein